MSPRAARLIIVAAWLGAAGCGGFACQKFPEGRACVAHGEPEPADAPPAGGYRETTTHPR